MVSLYYVNMEPALEFNVEREAHETLRFFLQSAVAHKLFSRTARHPTLGALITWAPTLWLVTLANPMPLDTTTTGGADGLPDHRVDLETLFQDMLDHGMRDPFILGTGLNKRTRLETGNQRIQCALLHELPFVPVISYVNDTAITNSENGKHQGRLLELNDTALSTSYRQHIQSSNVLVGAPLITMDFSGMN